MHNPQFRDERNSSANIAERLKMEIHDFHHAGPPEDDSNLVQLLIDARNYILYLNSRYAIPVDLAVPEEK